MVALKIIDIEKLARSKEVKKGIKVNSIVKKRLVERFYQVPEYIIDQVVREIPEYNPETIKEAVDIGTKLIHKRFKDKIWH